MSRPLKPRELFRFCKTHLTRSSQELIQRSFHGGDGLSLKSVLSSKPSLLSNFAYTKSGFQHETLPTSNGPSLASTIFRFAQPHLSGRARELPPFCSRSFSTMQNRNPLQSASLDSFVSPRIKFKRLDKTSRHIMQILDKEAVTEVKSQRAIPDVKPGYIVEIKVEVPENKRRVSTLKGIVIARRNSGLNTTFRVRRLVAGVGVESLFLLYSPNIKQIKVLDKKKVRRAKLYYLRDRMNILKKQ